MTAVAGIIDPDVQARSAFFDAVTRHFDTYHETDVSDHTAIGPLECLWRTCRAAPISTARSGVTAVWVIGHLDEAQSSAKNAAERIAAHVETKGVEGLASYSGYFLAIVDHAGDTYVFCDQLGLFPCYYATAGRALLVGTSSDLPGFHPSVSRRLNVKALISHLLCMHELLGESLWEGVRRLGQGEILHVADGHLDRICQQAIPISDDSFGAPVAVQLERAHGAMLDALRGYDGQAISLLCSGGLDSRLAVAYLGQSSAEVRMVYTLGDPRDNDYRCARRLLKSVRLPHRRVPVDLARFPDFLDREIVTEQVANGVNDLGWWTLLETIEDTTLPLVTGYLGDAVLGFSRAFFGYDPERRAFTFDKQYEVFNQWGLSESSICALLPGDRTVRWLAEIKDELRAIFDSFPGLPFQKAWQFDLMHHERFHAAGPLLRLSHGVWPVAPLASSALLRVAGGMPASAILYRRLQKDLLIARFPKLARIPVDIAHSCPERLIPSLSYSVRSRVSHMIGRRWRRLRGQDNRYYYRIYNLNHEGWRQLRARCHEACEVLPEGVDRDQLRAIVPAPTLHVQEERPHALSGIKSLLAFVLWYQRYADVLGSGDRTADSRR